MAAIYKADIEQGKRACGEVPSKLGCSSGFSSLEKVRVPKGSDEGGESGKEIVSWRRDSAERAWDAKAEGSRLFVG